jgi:hypothetical protein
MSKIAHFASGNSSFLTEIKYAIYDIRQGFPRPQERMKRTEQKKHTAMAPQK